MVLKKYAFVLLGVLFIKLFHISFFTDEINLCGFMSRFAMNLYTYDATVGVEDIEVIDYRIEEERLYIEPLRQEVILPISGIVSDVTNDYIEIQSSNQVYQVYHIKPDYRLYQYYNCGMILGHSDGYYVKCVEYNAIVSHLVIQYESV